ncbi:tetratricopeptide repeat protein [Microbispora sp. NPDC049125]|uniref:tetratricopeptide repeat protein n=1 Tax=Microbispora sp. NPDC049125 TaxID=3154929 RepID=UPI0034654259
MSEPAGTTYDVFVVHAQADLEWARRLQARLSLDGVRAALEDYLPGDIVIRRIEDLICASACTVFVYSRATEADPMTAAKYAALLARPDERGFIPALLDDVPIGPFAAARFVLNFRGEDQEGPYQELLAALRGRRPPAEPLGPYGHHRPEGAREVVLRIAGDVVSFGPAGGEPEATHTPGTYGHALEERVWRLTRAREGRFAGALTKGVVEKPGALLDARLRDVGIGLGEVFLSGAAGQALASAMAGARRRNSALRLGVQVDGDLAELPWETLILPGQDRPLALHPCVELFRHLPADGHIPAIRIPAPLRILAVAASPDGPDGGPLLDLEAELRRILDAVDDARRHAAAHVRILNEGSLSAVEDALKQERFHVLHISCHAGPGVLVLEDDRGGIDEVTASRLAGVIPRDEGVPLVVLSGCSTALDARAASGRSEGEAALSGLARGLSAAGVPAVLAMTAPVTDSYATALAASLYRELAVRPAPVVLTALSEARRDLEARRSAETAAEWATPALFLRGPSLPLYDVRDGVDAKLRPPRAVRLAAGVVVRAMGDFVGRRAELRGLRAALRDHAGVVVHGIGGVGKSSLAAELIGRLGHDAGLVVSAVGRVTPDQILGKVADTLLAATAMAGASGEGLRDLTQFLRRLDHPWSVRLDGLVQALGTVPAELNRRLGVSPVTLLLDDFEDNLDVADGLAFLDRELAAFLSAWTRLGRETRLVVTSRHPVDLPAPHGAVHTHHLGPLSWAEARKLMWRLPGLDALPYEDQRRAWAVVGGHPRTLEYLDALLRGGQARFADVRERLERLLERQGIADPGTWFTTAGGDLDGVLAKAVTLAVDDTLLHDLVALLDDLSRRVLAGVSVFRRPVDRAGVAWPVGTLTAPDPDREERLIRLDALLRRARIEKPDAGLEDLGLPAGELKQARTDVAAMRMPPIVEPDGLDASITALTRLGLLTPAVDDRGEATFVVHRWTAATLAHPELTAPERMRSAHEAAAGYWRWRVMARLQSPKHHLDDMVEARHHHHAAGDLIAAADANQWVCRRLHTWGAWGWEEQLHHEMLSWFPRPSRHRAIGLLQLGVIAQERGDHEQALEQYRRALAVFEELGIRDGVAAGYHQLGNVAYLRGDHDQALEWYRESLAVNKELGDRSRMAAGHHQLGVIAQERGDHEEALEQYRRSLALEEELGNKAGIATCYHQLGNVAVLRNDYDQAMRWYRRSLAIKEQLRDRPGLAAGYHQLGMLAQQRKHTDEALTWYRRSLAIKEELGNEAGMAQTIGQLGWLYTEAGHAAEGVAYSLRSLSIRVRLQLPQVVLDLHWLSRQREAVGEEDFRRVLAEHLDAESLDTVIHWLDGEQAG